MKLVHTLDSHVDLVCDDVTLFSYVYRPDVPAIESPRPYFHPLRTLGGRVVSGFRPHDHRWHHGLSMTCAHLSGHNFWGGPTFVDGAYRQLDNVGYQQEIPLSLVMLPSEISNTTRFYEDIEWYSQQDMMLFVDNRHAFAQIEDDHWILGLYFHLNDFGMFEAVWGSPTTQGRENAGYGGLFWRGPRDFINGQILMSEGREGADLMGQKSPWLAYIGQHDETNDFSTLIFIDDARNPRHPTPWFVRNSTPMVCPYFAFHDEYKQDVNQSLTLNYRIIIADGKWSRERIESVV